MSTQGRRRGTSRRRKPQPDVPVLPAALDPLDVVGLRAQREHEGVELVDCDFSGEHLSGSSLETARVKGCRFADAELRRLRFEQVVFETCDFANTSWFDCDLDEVAFVGCRFAGFAPPAVRDLTAVMINTIGPDRRETLHEMLGHFGGCRFVGASITGGRLSAVLLRDCLAQMAKLSHLGRPHALLQGCDLRGALLMESDLSETRFADCDLGGLELFNAGLVGTDLRGNELDDLKGVACLRGATIDALQLLALAPALATHVGLVVQEADVQES